MDWWFFIEVFVGGLLSGVMYSLVATKEYITPDNKPPTKTSIKNHQSIILLLNMHQLLFVQSEPHQECRQQF